MVRIASYNVENLFARPKDFRAADPDVAEQILAAYEQVNLLFKKAAYSEADKAEMKRLLVVLEIYYLNMHGAVRRKDSLSPRWAWLRKNRGSFDREPDDKTKSAFQGAGGRGRRHKRRLVGRSPQSPRKVPNAYTAAPE